MEPRRKPFELSIIPCIQVGEGLTDQAAEEAKRLLRQGTV